MSVNKYKTYSTLLIITLATRLTRLLAYLLLLLHHSLPYHYYIYLRYNVIKKNP